MVTALFSSSLPTKEALSFPEISIANARVQKVAFVFFGAISFFVANSLLSCGGIIAFLSIPAYLLTLTFAIRFFEVKDYTSETKLQAYREEAKEQTFEQIVRTHGLRNTLKYQILPIETFTAKLGLYLDTISPTDLAKLYLQLVDSSEELDMSMDNFRPTFVASLNISSRERPSEMFEKEDMTALLQTGLLGEQFAASYQEYRKLKDHREQADEISRQAFAKGILEAIPPLDTAITKVSSESSPITEWISTLRRDITYLRGNPYLSSAIEHLPIWKDPDPQITDAPELIRTHRLFREQFKGLKTTLERELSEHRVKFESKVAEINLRFRV